ncbi:GNAT family N-acetyltransferase [Geobacter sp.]|uniref:GNAT family N-acetyltransferase n=1 Tax=Geobacter sp. TaxID=46610 RepID=UPI00261E739B|nr:GNAT family N-acetyltransferase [Geobacter sp.]
MEVRCFSGEDFPAFLALADGEGWLCDRWEFDFLLGAFPGGCFTLTEGDDAVAFVTSVRYGESGWIGNLIVDNARRGRGYGTLLMQRAIDALLDAGAKTIWLTASAAGRPIYERMGFREVDRVLRWRGTGRCGHRGGGEPTHLEEMTLLDRAGWGDDRRLLLEAVAARGTVLLNGDGFLVLQPFGDGFQVGPWGCEGRERAAELLAKARDLAGEGRGMFLDAPAGNGHVPTLLAGSGFAPAGTTSLMYAGIEPAYDPERIFALATMGSMG